MAHTRLRRALGALVLLVGALGASRASAASPQVDRLAEGRITYLVPPDCVPPAVANELGRIQPAHITLIGGPAALSENVENLVRCTS